MYIIIFAESLLFLKLFFSFQTVDIANSDVRSVHEKVFPMGAYVSSEFAIYFTNYIANAASLPFIKNLEVDTCGEEGILRLRNTFMNVVICIHYQYCVILMSHQPLYKCPLSGDREKHV